MKKVLSALLAAVVTVSLAGCDTKSRNESTQPTSNPLQSRSESSSDSLPPAEENSSPEQSINKSVSTDLESGSNSLPQAGESSTVDNKSPEESTSNVSENSTPLLAAIIRPDVKKAIDSYEEFIDEYCKFMKEYTSSSNPMLMMSEYLDYMQKMSEMSEKFDKIDDNDWTTAETAYYTEVMLRCQNKLLGIV